jgi:DNA-binding NarL/FixJ family response regulator
MDFDFHARHGRARYQTTTARINLNAKGCSEFATLLETPCTFEIRSYSSPYRFRLQPRCFRMKPTFRTIRGQDQPNRGNGDRLGGSGKRAEPRTRMLLFACGSDDAQLMMLYSSRVEIAHLPSHDMEEVRDEIERFKPKLILCGADAFLDALPSPSKARVNHPKPNATRTMAEGGKPLLARREMKILTMLAKGQSNDEIAKVLRLSSRTVKRVLSSLFERLQVTNRTELVGRVAELSLLEDDN